MLLFPNKIVVLSLEIALSLSDREVKLGIGSMIRAAYPVLPEMSLTYWDCPFCVLKGVTGRNN